MARLPGCTLLRAEYEPRVGCRSREDIERRLFDCLWIVRKTSRHQHGQDRTQRTKRYRHEPRPAPRLEILRAAAPDSPRARLAPARGEASGEPPGFMASVRVSTPPLRRFIHCVPTDSSGVGSDGRPGRRWPWPGKHGHEFPLAEPTRMWTLLAHRPTDHRKDLPVEDECRVTVRRPDGRAAPAMSCADSPGRLCSRCELLQDLLACQY